jgi:hypothetical protein
LTSAHNDPELSDKHSDDTATEPDAEEEFAEEEQEDFERSALVLSEEEKSVVASAKELGIDLREFGVSDLIFEQIMREERPRRPRRTSIPRASITELSKQLSDERASHPTMTGFVVPSKGYVEVFLDTNERPGVVSFSADRILELEADRQECVHENPDHALFTTPYQSRFGPRASSPTARLHLASPRPNLPCLEISNASPLAKLLYGRSTYSARPALTIKVAYEKPQALDGLVNSADELIRSLLYELNVRNGRVARMERRSTLETRPLARGWIHSTSHARYPRISIQHEVSDLFNFASQANDNPPLAFLSYYQTLEYFIPAAIRQNAFKKIRHELRDPMFDERNDSCLMRVVSATERSVNLPEIGQLRILVNEYARVDRLTEFFQQDWGDHFKRQGPIKAVEPINLSNTSKSICEQAADRIYQIRNRIVHAKDDPRYEDARVLLPRSSEAEALGPDVQLVRLVATEAILAAQGS